MLFERISIGGGETVEGRLTFKVFVVSSMAVRKSSMIRCDEKYLVHVFENDGFRDVR